MLVTVIPSCIEEGLSVGEKGDVDFAGSYFLVSTNNFELTWIVAERNIVSK